MLYPEHCTWISGNFEKCPKTGKDHIQFVMYDQGGFRKDDLADIYPYVIIKAKSHITNWNKWVNYGNKEGTGIELGSRPRNPALSLYRMSAR